MDNTTSVETEAITIEVDTPAVVAGSYADSALVDLNRAIEGIRSAAAHYRQRLADMEERYRRERGELEAILSRLDGGVSVPMASPPNGHHRARTRGRPATTVQAIRGLLEKAVGREMRAADLSKTIRGKNDGAIYKVVAQHPDLFTRRKSDGGVVVGLR